MKKGMGLKRLLSWTLCICMCLSTCVFGAQQVRATDGAAAGDDYKAELAERQAEYAKKFDMTTLKWSGATSANGNINYGTTARNYLYWQGGSFGGVQYRNYIHVFAFEGDTICFGSDVYNSTLNADGTAKATAAQQEEYRTKLGSANATVDIVLTDLSGNRILYDVRPNGTGHIANVQQEVLAKTMESPDGHEETTSAGKAYSYVPLQYEVRETGVYTLEFHSFDYNNNDGQTTKNDTVDSTDKKNVADNFYAPVKYTESGTTVYHEPTDAQHGALVAAWDVSVFNEQGHKETGRVYADYLSMQQNGGHDVRETYYVLTTDSYIYRWEWKGLRPNTYNFFADNHGLTDAATNSTLYKSVKELSNANFDYKKFGASFKYPGSVNTDLSKSYYIFFEMPNADLEGHLYTRALQPDPAENIQFVDHIEKDGKEIPGAYKGRGGYFSFETKEATTATLVLDFEQLTDADGNPVVKGDGSGHTYAPVTISGPVTPYSINYFYWDGKDGNGEVIPAGDYNISDILTLTTKAGEIHFPVHDVESATGGFTFTRVSPIYDRDGNKVDEAGNILDATKSIIYYDDSAIYYGERVGRSAKLTEADVQAAAGGTPLRQANPTLVVNDGDGGEYYRYNNMIQNTGGEYNVRAASEAYVNGVTTKKDASKEFVRIGDHSHVTNKIEYYNTGGGFKTSFADQQAMIDYLDSAKHPVDISTGGNNTYDYGISDFWTFIPAEPAKMEATSQIITIADGQAFNLTGQVFYDNDKNGLYDSMAGGDSLLSDVTLNLYKRTTDTSRDPAKTYYKLTTVSGKVNSQDKIGASRTVLTAYTVGDLTGEIYELYKQGVTAGRYFFTNIPYKNGDTFVYEVVRPNSSYCLTSGQTKPVPPKSNSYQYGGYCLYAYDDTAGLGVEVQKLTIDNTSTINPNSNIVGEDNGTVTAVDVGYYYQPYTKLTLQKTWDLSASSTDAIEATPVFELCYTTTDNTSHVYDERPLAKIDKLTHSYELLFEEVGGQTVKDWYVAAEYYIFGTKLFKHTFQYDATTGNYQNFVGDNFYVDLPDTNGDGVRNQLDFEDLNRDGMSDWKDLSYITGWKSALPAGSKPAAGETVAPFNAVLDRNTGSAEVTINITNAEDPGVIEIQKYTGAVEDGNYLSGATFRLYSDLDGDGSGVGNEKGSLTLSDVQTRIDKGDSDAMAWLDAHQVGSATTRGNGRVAFAGLDPDKHYILREVFAPAGYRVMEALYIIHPDGCAEYHKDRPSDMTDDAVWELYQTQNLVFGSDGYVLANIANIPANGDMAIRKRINGRAWNGNDKFTFDLAFWKENTLLSFAADTYNYPGAIEIDEKEFEIQKGTDSGVAFYAKMQAFIEAINRAGGVDDVTVNYNSPEAKNIISVNGQPDMEEALPDTRQSVSLIVNDDPIELEDGGYNKTEPDDAMLNTSTTGDATPAPDTHFFPAAGTYTFTVRENPDAADSTMRSTNRVFTLVVDVTRRPNPDTDSSATLTTKNSYLHADVRGMYYQDPKDAEAQNPVYPTDYSGRRSWAGVAPTFTNTYFVQPVAQKTSYSIEKSFTGRLDETGDIINKGEGYKEGWLDTDRFTVEISGYDEATQQALEKGNIYIGGLHGNTDNYAEIKHIVFNQTNVTNGYSMDPSYPSKEVDEGHTFHFEEMDFKDLAFPVEWIFSTDDAPTGYKKGDPVPPEEGEKNVVLSVTEAMAEYYKLSGGAGNYFVEDAELTTSTRFYPVISRTQDIVYKLVIDEIDSGVGGITYDKTKYTMVIILKNSLTDGVEADPDDPNKDVTDGIIDEMDLRLYKAAPEEIDEHLSPQATCETDQRVVTSFADWTNPEAIFADIKPDPSSGATTSYSQYYVNNKGEIREVTVRDGRYFVYIDGRETEINESTFNDFRTNQGVTFIVKHESHAGTHAMKIENVYSEATEWTPTVTKTLQGRDWLADEAFTFTIMPTSWPGSGDAHKPKIDGDGSVAISPTEGKMGERYTAFLPTVTFDSPGTYKFTVTETGGKGLGSGGMDPKLGHTEITVVATSNEGKLSLAVSADPDKYDSGGAGSFFENNSGNVTLNFINSYNESGAFPLSLTKELTGRLWTTERFTFTIEPDDVAKAAIADGTLTLPADWHADSDGKYTFTIDNTASSETTAEGWTKRTLPLGELHVGNVGAKKMQYQFTIREDTSSFDAEDLACIQPDILLTVTTNSYNTESHLEGKVSFGATYAYLTDGVRGDDIELDGTEVIVPFVNNDTRIGSITVEKTIQNDTPSLTDSFNFQIRLTNSEGMVLSSEALKATDGGGSPVEIEWRTEDGGTLVGSFALCHEQKLVLENVPYGTDYTVTEEKTNGYHLQEVLDKTGAQIAAGTGGDGFDARHRAVSGTLDHDHSEIYLHFVNGRAFYVPFTGGLGWLLWTVLGIALLTVPPCIYYCIRRRRQRSM